MKRLGLIVLPLVAGGAAVAYGAIQQQQQPRAFENQNDRIEVVLPGFEVQHLYTIPLSEQGSWVSLTVGPDGSLYASDQGQAGVYRIRVGGTLTNPEVESVTRVPLEVTGFQGLEYAFGYLYANRNGSNASGLYRLSDRNQDGELDLVEYFGVASGSGEHGTHYVVDAEDGDHLYLLAGNMSSFSEELITRRTQSGWDEDHLLPRVAVGHARGTWTPGGFVLKLNKDASDVAVFSMGYRNSYGAALNEHGEVFVYDSDLEFDMGSSWYRPTRVVHAVSGSDFGWRHGTGKLPPYYEDTWPALAEIGPGSPTGVISGRGARFPAKYQHAIYALDWTYSTIFAIHLTPDGSSYRAEFEEFVAGNSEIENSLQVTDAVIGADGHLYFLTGGRSTQGDLWRVVYTGNESTAPAPAPDTPEARAARELRHQIEEFHGRVDPAAVDFAWPHLSSPDRYLRNAARVAIEWQPVHTWAQRALTEPNPQGRIAAIVALARVGTPEFRGPATRALLELPISQLTADQKLGMLRAFSLVFIRLGDPTEEERAQIRQALNALLPDAGGDYRVNKELVEVLVYLRDDQVTSKAMALIRNRAPSVAPSFYQEQRMRRSTRYGGNPLAIISNPPPTEAMGIAWALRMQREGWTEQLRREYFEFANHAMTFRGGSVFITMLQDMVAEALRHTSPEHRAAVADITGRTFVDEPDFVVTPPQGPGRQWTQQEATAAVQPRLTNRNYEAGRNLFFAAGCAECHRVNQYGSDLGPDLTLARGGMQRIIEKITVPDLVVEANWYAREFTLADGRKVIGSVTYNGDRAIIRPRDVSQAPVEVPATQIVSVRKLNVSAMPPNLGNLLNEEELADLVAFIQSGGNPDAQVYRAPTPGN
ncbi:MAG TPA: c-type cytochrome [Longimicrobiales bacterium]|nr:c-type cytochrome [Longimicrobiales bacterium]